MKIIIPFLLSLCMAIANAAEASKDQNHQVSSLKVTTLSTMLASRGIGEWGYAALIEVDGRKILFDTGNRPQTVLQNAGELGIDLSDVEDVILSHNHGDHTGGLESLRKSLREKNAKALTQVHVGNGIFEQRARRENQMLAMKNRLEKDKVVFNEYTNVQEIFPGVWLTGNVPRVHPERNWGGNGRIITPKGEIEDNIPEDMSLVINTKQGLVLISGCGHAGIINTMEHAVNKIPSDKVFTAIGGFHLVSADDKHLEWTANKLKSFGLKNLMGAHCTGINSLYTLRRLLNSDRRSVVVGTVGDKFSLENGVEAGFIAR
ncbi:MAG: MBL fold metallo-hydrolase [Kangiellaceae bacterium]|nr:MBL fold metallo-hydrolase [Kangiellaceae bacterium]MCW8998261.1 MBL fold metallo-hydrolase [Kangiellaceae bacterium]